VTRQPAPVSCRAGRLAPPPPPLPLARAPASAPLLAFSCKTTGRGRCRRPAQRHPGKLVRPDA